MPEISLPSESTWGTRTVYWRLLSSTGGSTVRTPLSKSGPWSWRKSRLGAVGGVEAGDGGEIGADAFGGDGCLRFSGGDAAVGGCSAVGNPGVKVVEHGAEQGGDVEGVGRVLEGLVVGAFDMVGAVLCGGEEIDAGAVVVRKVVAKGVGVDEGTAALPVFGGGLGVDD